MSTGKLKQYRKGFLQCTDCCTEYVQSEKGLAKFSYRLSPRWNSLKSDNDLSIMQLF